MNGKPFNPVVGDIVTIVNHNPSDKHLMYSTIFEVNAVTDTHLAMTDVGRNPVLGTDVYPKTLEFCEGLALLDALKSKNRSCVLSLVGKQSE